MKKHSVKCLTTIFTTVHHYNTGMSTVVWDIVIESIEIRGKHRWRIFWHVPLSYDMSSARPIYSKSSEPVWTAWAEWTVNQPVVCGEKNTSVFQSKCTELKMRLSSCSLFVQPLCATTYLHCASLGEWNSDAVKTHVVTSINQIQIDPISSLQIKAEQGQTVVCVRARALRQCRGLGSLQV